MQIKRTNGLLGKPTNNPNGRPSYRLYCFPDGKEYTLKEIKANYPEKEVQAIIKRCKRVAMGYSIKYSLVQD